MIPEYLIIDEIKRRQQERSWEPEALRLPLYIPNWPPRREEEAERDTEDDAASRVIIIEM
jgi:hypothetical protein